MAKTKRKRPARASKRAQKRAKAKKAAKRVAKVARRAKAAPRKTAKTSARQAAKASSRKTPQRKRVPRPSSGQAPRTSAAQAARPSSRQAPRPGAGPAARPTSGPATTAVKTAKRRPSRPRRAPTLDRERRRVTEPEVVPTPPSSLDMDRSASAARSGRAELAQKLHRHTSTGPAMTAGDVDADWESAESTGDEAPGGDNPTPDQDVVDDIGKALGVEYDDEDELRGGDEIGERDRHRWELDPASRDDFDEEE